MGILNVTPDSFYDGGRYISEKQILLRCETMLREGGRIIDVGGCSTRPGGEIVSEEIENERVMSALRAIRRQFPEVWLSVDTFRASVARRAVSDFAVELVNDISGGGMDDRMFRTVAETGVPYVLSHHPAADLPDAAALPVVERVMAFFSRRLAALHDLGVKQVCLDPGIGFGKTVEENFTLLRHLHQFHALSAPILIGVSRKSLIFKTLKTTPDASLAGTTALHALALEQGVHVLRAHDVKEAVDCVQIVQKYLS